MRSWTELSLFLRVFLSNLPKAMQICYGQLSGHLVRRKTYLLISYNCLKRRGNKSILNIRGITISLNPVNLALTKMPTKVV